MIKNKAFTLVELIIVIAVLSIIMLIGVPAFAQIVERMQVRSDKASANEIGKALTVRENMVPEEKRLPYYPVITRYDQIEDIGTYISDTHRPQSMKNGYYFATALQVDNIKKILVGIGKEEMPVTNTVYSSPRSSGWAYIDAVEIGEFLGENSDMLNEVVDMPSDYVAENIDGGSNEANNSGNQGALAVGQYVQYTPPSGDYSITVNGKTSNFSKTSDWQVFSVSGNTVALISTNSVGSLTLGGKEGYTDIVRVLNSISRKYVDNNLISSGRGLGCTPGISVESVTSPITYTDSTTSSPYEDSTYRSDVGIISSYPDLQLGSEVWLGSRYIFKTESSTSFSVRYLINDDGNNGQSLYIAKLDGTEQSDGERAFGVRPIIYLSTDTKIGNGEGTVGSPYKLYK